MRVVPFGIQRLEVRWENDLVIPDDEFVRTIRVFVLLFRIEPGRSVCFDGVLELFVLGLFISDPLIGQRISCGEIAIVDVACERFWAEVSLSKAHSAQSIGDDVRFTLDVGKLRTEFFDEKTPSHDAFGIEVLVHQVLVVSEDFYLLTKEDVSTLL